MRLENTETFTNMAKESSIFADRFAVVDTPQEYYTVMSFIGELLQAVINFLFSGPMRHAKQRLSRFNKVCSNQFCER